MVSHSVQKLFVEGGGDNDALRTECRRAFTKLMERAGLSGRKPRVVACGGRQRAYDQFCVALDHSQAGDLALLLVDAEAPVVSASPWEHVRSRPGDGWKRPPLAGDEHLHLMVQCMESWLLADRSALRSFFGNGLQDNALPVPTAIESMPTTEALAKLQHASQPCKTKGKYDKAAHSFLLLELVDPTALRAASPWADRFFKALESMLA